jgi:hypothetical protein
MPMRNGRFRPSFRAVRRHYNYLHRKYLPILRSHREFISLALWDDIWRLRWIRKSKTPTKS